MPQQSSQPLIQPIEITLSVLNSQLEAGAIAKLYEEFDTNKPYIQVSGFLGQYRNRTLFGDKYVGVQLSEGLGKFFHTIDLVVPRRLLEVGFHEGQYVSVRGLLGVRCRKFTFAFSISVDQITRAGRAQVETADSESSLSIEMLKILGVKRNQFRLPPEGKISVAVVHSRSSGSEVLDDFCHQFNPRSQKIQIKSIPANVSDSEALAAAISLADGDVIAVIRGGGDQSEISELDTPSVVAAFAKKDAYRVLGIGHARTSTVLDLLCEYSATTPSAAGAHINEVVTRALRDITKIEELSRERAAGLTELEDLRKALGGRDAALKRERDDRETVLRKERDEQAGAFRKEREAMEARFRIREVRLYQMCALIACISLVLGFVIAWRWLH